MPTSKPHSGPRAEAVDWRQRAREALSRSEIMVLGTVDADSGTWTSPVQFSTPSSGDGNGDGAGDGPGGFVLTFLSRPRTRHGANIDRDPRVAVSIYSWPGPEGGNLGLQLSGRAQSAGTAAGGWQPYTIHVEAVWCFDSRIDHDRHPVDPDL